MRPALVLLEVLVALEVEEDLDNVVVQVVQEMIRQQVRLKEKMVVMLLHYLVLHSMEVVVVAELLK